MRLSSKKNGGKERGASSELEAKYRVRTAACAQALDRPRPPNYRPGKPCIQRLGKLASLLAPVPPCQVPSSNIPGRQHHDIDNAQNIWKVEMEVRQYFWSSTIILW